MIQQLRGAFRRMFIENKDVKRRVLVIVGVVGIFLIALSEWLPRSDVNNGVKTGTQSVSVSDVEAALEKRVTALIGQVEGVGDCRVMVTLESGSRYVYAAEQSYETGNDSQTVNEKTLFVDTEQGPVGLLITEIQPTVKGVAVVCDGGDDPTVRERVVGLVGAALNLSSGRIFVVKQK